MNEDTGDLEWPCVLFGSISADAAPAVRQRNRRLADEIDWVCAHGGDTKAGDGVKVGVI